MKTAFNGIVFIDYSAGPVVFFALQQVPLKHSYLKTRNDVPIVVSDREFEELKARIEAGDFDETIVTLKPLNRATRVFAKVLDTTVLATVIHESNGKVLMSLEGPHKITLERDRSEVIVADMAVTSFA